MADFQESMDEAEVVQYISKECVERDSEKLPGTQDQQLDLVFYFGTTGRGVSPPYRHRSLLPTK